MENFYKEYDDKILVDFLKVGDELAFNEIYYRYWKKLYSAAFALVDDEAVCNDVIQEIFIWLWIKRTHLAINALSVYLLTAVKFKMLNVIRQGKISDKALKMFQLTANNMLLDKNLIEIKELQNLIETFIKTLPKQAAKIFHLSRNEQLSHKEIAEQLSISEKTVKNQINISLKKFRVVFNKHFSMLIQLF